MLFKIELPSLSKSFEAFCTNASKTLDTPGTITLVQNLTDAELFEYTHERALRMHPSEIIRLVLVPDCQIPYQKPVWVGNGHRHFPAPLVEPKIVGMILLDRLLAA